MPFTLDLETFEEMLPQRVDLASPSLDLRQCCWVYPQGAMGLLLLLRYHVRKGARPRVFRPVDQNVDSYLERMGIYLLTHLDVEYIPDLSNVLGHIWTERDTMQAVTPVESAEQVAALVEKFQHGLAAQLSNQGTVNNLSHSVLEILENMPLHANPADPERFEGYANIQTYMNGRKVMVAVGDLGVGIKESLQTSKVYRTRILTHCDAVLLAAENKASRFHGTKRRHHGGGLHRAIEHARLAECFIYVRTGDSMVVWGPGEYRSEEKVKFFPGTQILIVARKN